MNDRPGSITPRQKQSLIMAAKAQGLDVDALRDMTPQRSLRKLSSAEASAMLARFGRDMPAPPGKAPAPYAGRPAPGVHRMITPEHVQHIERLMRDVWPGDPESAERWLYRRFGVSHVRGLETPTNAGLAIGALKQMLAAARRRANKAASRA
jgi:hypothetical protein